MKVNGEPLCGVCNKALKTSKSSGNQQQADLTPGMCKTCNLKVHAQCQNLALTNCMSRMVESSRAAAAEAEAGAKESNGSASGQVDAPKRGIISSDSITGRDNIRLHRLGASVKHTKRPDLTKPIIEGWLKHTSWTKDTLSDTSSVVSRQHYWRLGEKDITLYLDDKSSRFSQEIVLSNIKRVMSANSLPNLPKSVKENVLTGGPLSSPSKTLWPISIRTTPKSANASPTKSPELLAQMSAMFAFELATGSTYLVLASSQSEASEWKESLERARRASPAKQSGESQFIISTEPTVKKIEEPNGGELDKLVESVSKIELIKTAEMIDLDLPTKTEAKSIPKSLASGALNANITPVGDDKKISETLIQPKLQQQPPVPMQRQRQHQHHHHHNPPSGYYHHHRGGHRTYTDPNRSRLYNRPRITIELDPTRELNHIIAGKYLIERDRSKGVGKMELGSGQFGKVYAAISEFKTVDADKGLFSGIPVAIKEISKARFDLRQQEKLKNEADILSHLDHPGVIILERVHDSSEMIYIVMEQLEDDMLEMIVSSAESRLNERITKFLIYQILEALKYLHGKYIAHCDLKPENVLLVERRSQFPQIKLCDFGFAKIIEDNSFRSSLVGTPAYLAPEVVKGERYNKTVDLWSVGVIVYVSLSGEFPFNEGETIHDQISRANFMYPHERWARISEQAKDFINSLLRVNCERRLSAQKAQIDPWLQVKYLD